MCFYHPDVEYSESIEHSTAIGDGCAKCSECHRTIAGEYEVVHMMEHELCQACEYGDCECQRDGDGDCAGCNCDEPQHGRKDTYYHCQDCQKFLKAIKAVETEAGCASDELSPCYSTMIEELRDNAEQGDADDVRRYFDRAVVMFPELAGYLEFLEGEVFPCR